MTKSHLRLSDVLLLGLTTVVAAESEGPTNFPNRSPFPMPQQDGPRPRMIGRAVNKKRIFA